ncbi:11-beta-hydroxysteroid dehydrogenase type 2-like isoform X2 [Eriocheir sinensis]|uniref:11-beta-hydroxysteroid dehydrogenase type 2-like isoform X2 n=1 Tax=Eriocheir sinensis TaxID=95602 RepID=UPI0021C87A56|nr:11-beta-hydroxysteroid dehydrogenase type 2-like isoform X2 [Eriocheir sinensis]
MKLLTLDVWADIAFYGGVSAALSSAFSLAGLLPCLALFISLWAVCIATCLVRASLQVSVAGKAVLITGCDTGFGFALAQHLDALGFRVIACCLARDGEGAKKLRASASSRLHILQLDVTSADDVLRTQQEVEALLPDGEVLWGVVNNAGVSTFGEVEWAPENTFRKMLEVNVLGTVAVTRAFLPLIRRAKATNIFTDDAVRAQGEAMWNALSQRARSDYTREYFEATVERMLYYTNVGIPDITPVIEAMTAALTQASPRARYSPMDLATRIRIFVATHLPEYFYDTFYAMTFPDHPGAAKPEPAPAPSPEPEPEQETEPESSSS